MLAVLSISRRNKLQLSCHEATSRGRGRARRAAAAALARVDARKLKCVQVDIAAPAGFTLDEVAIVMECVMSRVGRRTEMDCGMTVVRGPQLRVRLLAANGEFS